MKIRLHGTVGECREAAARLPAIGEVLSVSKPYPDHGTSRLVRVFAEICLGEPSPAVSRPVGDGASSCLPEVNPHA